MVYYKYKKEKLEEKFLESKVFLVKIRECIKRNIDGEDDIINEAMISYFNSFCEFIIDMCETYLVSTDNYIPNKSGSEIIELASSFGFISAKDSKRLQAIIKLRNRYTHDYYIREESEKLIEEFCFNRLAYLDIFLGENKDKVILKYKDKE